MCICTAHCPFYISFLILHKTLLACNGLLCADVPLRNYSINQCNTPLMLCAIPLPVGCADLRVASLPLQPGTSEHRRTTDMGLCIARCACLLSRLSAVYKRIWIWIRVTAGVSSVCHIILSFVYFFKTDSENVLLIIACWKQTKPPTMHVTWRNVFTVTRTVKTEQETSTVAFSL